MPFVSARMWPYLVRKRKNNDLDLTVSGPILYNGAYHCYIVNEWNKLDVTNHNIGAVSSHQSDLLFFKELLVKFAVDRFKSHFTFLCQGEG